MSLPTIGGCPASRLPTEIIQEVFWKMIDWLELSSGFSVERRPLERYKRLSSLMLVCKRWHAIIIDFPDLWCTITSDFHPTLMSYIMKRSRGRLLNVECRSGVTQERRAQIKNLVDRVAPLAHRCESLFLSSYGEPEEYFLPLLTHAAPQLRHLDLRWTVADGEPPMDLFSKSAVRLTVLHLVSAEVVWSSSIFSNLEVLSLMSISRGPTVVELVQLIKSSPRLQTLEIEDVTLTLDDGQAWPACRVPLILPSLKRLVLNSDYESSLRWEHVLSQFKSIPSCQTLQLDFAYTEESPQTKLLSLSGLQTDLVRIYASACRKRITCRVTWINTTIVELVADASKVTFRGEVNVPILSPVLDWAANLSGFLSDPKISIRVILSKAANVESLIPLNQYRVNNVEVDDTALANSTGEYLSLFRALAGRGTGEWAETFAFPNMRILRLQLQGVVIEALLEMLRQRWEVVQRPEASVQPFKVSFKARFAQVDVMHLVAGIIGQQNVLYYTTPGDSGGPSKDVEEAFQAEPLEDD